MGRKERFGRFAQSFQLRKQCRVRRATVPWILVLFLFGPNHLVAVEIGNDLEAINVAGSERMMAMRMLKDYILVAMKNSYKSPGDDLRQMTKRFEATQKALHVYIKDPDTVKRLNEVDRMWVKAKKMLESPPKKEDAVKYLETMEALKNRADAAVLSMVDKSKRGIPQAVNMAGRLRAVSQKLAALYMLKTWEADRSSASFGKPMNKFRSSLDFLNKASGNDKQAKELLRDLEKIYLFFSIMEESGTFTPSLVVKMTDEMMKKADELTRYYVSKSNHKGGK